MNEPNFIEIEPIGNYKIHFKCFDASDGFQATFHLYNRDNNDISFKIDFEITGTEYNTDITNQGKSTGNLINAKYGNIENCLRKVGVKYIEERIKNNSLKNEIIDIIKFINI